jgi:hypothetical protein
MSHQPTATSSLSYRDAGVDIDAGDALVERIKPFARRTMRPEVLAGIGGFGALVEIGRRYRNPVLVAGTDGVGTKLKVAFALNRRPRDLASLTGVLDALDRYSRSTKRPVTVPLVREALERKNA